MKNARKPLFGMIALGAALAMPMAFAQEANTEAPPQDQEPAQSTAPAATGQPLTWADLDVDGNGTLSRAEAGNVPSLAQAFDEADADKDGELTPDEYKAFAAKASAEQPDGAGGSD
ncbi:MAG TPA: EF-hand domain-containing protein [Luteimonas sp.]|nr:EF-hand domain-containing protein [Luteimonas sp.]HRO25902.1 EF-hand domain-containing protein [Luteimonas sp.]HRP71785.1 EF-hand domain-containing protein [Luteimonas sp.]